MQPRAAGSTFPPPSSASNKPRSAPHPACCRASLIETRREKADAKTKHSAGLLPHSPCGTPGRASPTPTSRDCIHPFEPRLRLCDPEVATANSSWELSVGSSSKEKPTVTRAVTVGPSKAWLGGAPQRLLINSLATVTANHAFLFVNGLLIERHPFEARLAGPRNCAGN